LYSTSGLSEKSIPHKNITQSRIFRNDNTEIETNTENTTIETQSLLILIELRIQNYHTFSEKIIDLSDEFSCKCSIGTYKLHTF